MSQYSIVVLDTDSTRSDYFKSVFLRDDHDITIFTTIKDMISHAQQLPPTAFLVEYSTLTAENRSDVIRFFKAYTPNNIFIYNVPDNANKRLAFYELGAKRVFDTSQPLEEIFYALVWPLKNIKTETNKNLSISSGKLEDVPLKNLVSTLAREERTGILKIITEKNSGKIYFRDGFITHAQVGLHQGEKAILHILFWQSGNFMFHANASFSDHTSVNISLVSILLLAEELRQKYIENLDNIGSLDAVIQIRYAGDLSASSIKVEDGFKNLILHPAVLGEILENSYYTCFETAEKLIELKKYGFLTVNEPVKKVETPEQIEFLPEAPLYTSSLLTLDEAKQLDDNLRGNTADTEGNLLIISTKGQGSFYFMRHLVESSDDITHENDLYVSRVEFLSGSKYTVWGLSMNETIFSTIEKIGDKILGIIFLINVEEESMYEYSGYVIRRLTSLYDIPWIPVLFNTTDQVASIDIRNKFGMPGHIPVDLCDLQNRYDVRTMLLNLKKYEPPQEIDQETTVDKEDNL